jgi:uncharacterized protein
MPLKVETAKGETFSIHSPKQLEEIFPIKYTPVLQFSDGRTHDQIQKKCDKALRKGWITPRQKWLGIYYASGIRGTLSLDLTIRWIDEIIGYGVFTNTDLPANAFIGEYAGVVRKRRFFKRWQNLYCFDYNIGEGRRVGYVIDGQDTGNYTRFINHSFEPNLEPVSVYCDGCVHVILHAKSSIPAGTQLSYDYGEDYWKKRNKPSLI